MTDDLEVTDAIPADDAEGRPEERGEDEDDKEERT